MQVDDTGRNRLPGLPRAAPRYPFRPSGAAPGRIGPLRRHWPSARHPPPGAGRSNGRVMRAPRRRAKTTRWRASALTRNASYASRGRQRSRMQSTRADHNSVFTRPAIAAQRAIPFRTRRARSRGRRIARFFCPL